MRHHNPSNISFSFIFIAKLYSPLVALNDVESLLLKRKQFKPADWFLCFSTPKEYILSIINPGSDNAYNIYPTLIPTGLEYFNYQETYIYPITRRTRMKIRKTSVGN